MRKAALLLFSMALVCSCQTGAFAPIEIDLSKRTPAATATATPTRSASLASPSPILTPTPTPSSTQAPAPPEPAQQSLASPPLATPAAAKPGGVVDAQMDAYNRHDVEDLLRAYTPDAVFFDFPDRVRLSGVEQLRSAYSKEFRESSASQVAVSSRILQGNFVIEHETVSGFPGREIASRVVIYEVRDGKIRRVWFLQ